MTDPDLISALTHLSRSPRPRTSLASHEVDALLDEYLQRHPSPHPR